MSNDKNMVEQLSAPEKEGNTSVTEVRSIVPVIDFVNLSIDEIVSAINSAKDFESVSEVIALMRMNLFNAREIIDICGALCTSHIIILGCDKASMEQRAGVIATVVELENMAKENLAHEAELKKADPAYDFDEETHVPLMREFFRYLQSLGLSYHDKPFYEAYMKFLVYQGGNNFSTVLMLSLCITRDFAFPAIDAAYTQHLTALLEAYCDDADRIKIDLTNLRDTLPLLGNEIHFIAA